MISYVTCIFNRAHLFKKTIPTLLNQEHKNEYEIIIVDDGSTDDLSLLLKDYPQFKVVKTNRDGYTNPAYAINVGVKAAKGEYILYASPEVLHSGNSFDALHKQLEEQDALIYCTTYDLLQQDQDLIDSKSFEIFNDRKQLVGPENPRTGMYFLSGFRKDTFIRIGGMDESFITPCYEDNEFLYRVKRFGIKMILEDDIKGYHQWHTRSYMNSDSFNAVMHSRLIFYTLMLNNYYKLQPANHDNPNWGTL